MSPSRIVTGLLLAGLLGLAGVADARDRAPGSIGFGVPAGGLAAAGEGLASAGVYDAPTLLRSLEDGGMSLEGDTAPEKSQKKAMLYSAVLPGLGELYLGHKSRAAVFFVAEAAIWTSWFVLRAEGNSDKNRYQDWASIFAGISGNREDDDYYRRLGNYRSSDGARSYNEAVRRTARAIYPSDREAQEEYVAANGYFGADAWDWETEDAWNRYQDLYQESEDNYNNANLALGLLVLNRLVSVVDAALLGKRYNTESSDGSRSSLEWHLGVDEEGPGASLTMARTF